MSLKSSRIKDILISQVIHDMESEQILIKRPFSSPNSAEIKISHVLGWLLFCERVGNDMELFIISTITVCAMSCTNRRMGKQKKKTDPSLLSFAELCSSAVF